MTDDTAADRIGGPRVGSVVAAIAILRHLGTLPAGGGVNSIARSLGLSPSSCFNILKTLTDERFLDFDSATKAYTLGPGSIAVARRALDPGGAFALARPELERLAEAFQLTGALWRVSRKARFVLLGFAESEAATRIHITVGQRLPLLTGALGRCVAAHGRFGRDALAARLADIQWASAPAIDDYLADLERVRAHGWAIDESGFMHGVTTVAAPVTDDRGHLTFCVSSILFTGQYDPERLNEIGVATVAVAERLAERIYGAPRARASR